MNRFTQVVGVSVLAAICTASAVSAQSMNRPQPQVRQQAELPLCRNAERGQRCVTRSGQERIRGQRGDRNQLGGGDPGWDVQGAEPNALGGGEPGWGVNVPEPNQLEGADPGWGVEETEPNELGGGEPGWGRPAPDEFGGEDPGWANRAADAEAPARRQPDTRNVAQEPDNGPD
jgi:hypothetical protein